MRVGMSMFTQFALDSIRYVAKGLYEALVDRHELVFLPHEYPYLPEEGKRRMSDQFVRECDAIVGLINPALLAARERTGSDVPYLALVLGILPRGAWALRGEFASLTTRDVLLLNCLSDVELLDKFLANARGRILPLPYDPTVFHPLGEAERAGIREKLGFKPDDRIVLYAGRVTPEKNVHAVMRVFGAVEKLVPNAHLVIAGPVGGGGGFMEFGVAPIQFSGSINRVISRIGLPEDRVHLMGHAGGGRLRELYNIADVKLNLTLHHDENFGMAQVEAMACGTPVVGSAWGGLKDTIIDGVTGYKVSAIPTPSGVMVSWWEAVNRVVAVLNDRPGRERFREACARHAREGFSPARQGEVLEEILAETARERGQPAEPLRATDFAREYWSVCDPQAESSAPYRRGPRSFEMYRAIVGPFSQAMPEAVPPGEPLEPEQVLTLATPIEDDAAGGYRIDHALFPFELEVPPAHRDAFRAILAAARGTPALTVAGLSEALPASTRGFAEALAWMLEKGVLLRSRHVDGWVDPRRVDDRLSKVLFSVQKVDRASTDLLVY